MVVELRAGPSVRRTDTYAQGAYRFEGLGPGQAQVVFALVNFAGVRRRDVTVPALG